MLSFPYMTLSFFLSLSLFILEAKFAVLFCTLFYSFIASKKKIFFIYLLDINMQLVYKPCFEKKNIIFIIDSGLSKLIIFNIIYL